MQTTPQPAARNTPWSTHPGYDLSRYTALQDAQRQAERQARQERAAQQLCIKITDDFGQLVVVSA